MNRFPTSTRERHDSGKRAVNDWLIENYSESGRFKDIREMVEEAIGVWVSAADYIPPRLSAPGQHTPLRLRLLYAWRALRGQIRTVSPIDISQYTDTGWIEVRVQIKVNNPKVVA